MADSTELLENVHPTRPARVITRTTRAPYSVANDSFSIRLFSIKTGITGLIVLAFLLLLMYMDEHIYSQLNRLEGKIGKFLDKKVDVIHADLFEIKFGLNKLKKELQSEKSMDNKVLQQLHQSMVQIRDMENKIELRLNEMSSSLATVKYVTEKLKERMFLHVEEKDARDKFRLIQSDDKSLLVATSSENILMSHRGSLKYPSGLDRYWLICAPSGKQIKLKFIKFKTDFQHDFVKIFDGANILSPVIAIEHGPITPPGTFQTTSNYSLIYFHTDDNGKEDEGFEIQYSYF